jgi:hypothetical protein
MLNLLVPIIGTLLDKIIPDPKVAADAKFKIIELAQNGELAKLDADVKLALAQTDINKAEASTDMFRGGWRPFIGWICGLGLAIQFIISPLFTWLSVLLGYGIIFPVLDSNVLMTLLFGMLGLGTLRTTEKLKDIK